VVADGGAGTLCNGVCVASNDRANCGGCGVVCDPAAACESTGCVTVANAAKAWRVEVACTGGIGNFCDCSSATRSAPIMLTGTPGKTYALALRVRGVVEEKEHVANPAPGNAVGTNGVFFITGGNPKNDNWNVYRLSIASPAKVHYFNNGTSGHDYSAIIDYTATVVAAAGAPLTLEANPIEDRQARGKNQQGTDLTAPGLANYNGQFVQIDVASVTLIP